MIVSMVYPSLTVHTKLSVSINQYLFYSYMFKYIWSHFLINDNFNRNVFCFNFNLQQNNVLSIRLEHYVLN